MQIKKRSHLPCQGFGLHNLFAPRKTHDLILLNRLVLLWLRKSWQYHNPRFRDEQLYKRRISQHKFWLRPTLTWAKHIEETYLSHKTIQVAQWPLSQGWMSAQTSSSSNCGWTRSQNLDPAKQEIQILYMLSKLVKVLYWTMLEIQALSYIYWVYHVHLLLALVLLDATCTSTNSPVTTSKKWFVFQESSQTTKTFKGHCRKCSTKNTVSRFIVSNSLYPVDPILKSQNELEINIYTYT